MPALTLPEPTILSNDEMRLGELPSKILQAIIQGKKESFQHVLSCNQGSAARYCDLQPAYTDNFATSLYDAEPEQFVPWLRFTDSFL